MADNLDELKAEVGANPKDAGLRIRYGTALAEAGRFKEAAQEFEEAVTLDPDLALPHYNLGVLFGKLLLDDLAKDEMWEDHTDEEALFEKASSCYKEAIRLEPAMTAAMNNLGRLQAAMGLPDEAREYFELSLKADPDQTEVRQDLGDLDSGD